jgi:hypothetical protein
MSRFFGEVRKIIFWWARVFALGVEWFEAIMAGLQLKGNGKTDTRTKKLGRPGARENVAPSGKFPRGL